MLNTLKGYINKLVNFTGAAREGAVVKEGINFTEKALDVAVRPGKTALSQWEQIGKAMNYDHDNDIQFHLLFIK